MMISKGAVAMMVAGFDYKGEFENMDKPRYEQLSSVGIADFQLYLSVRECYEKIKIAAYVRYEKELDGYSFKKEFEILAGQNNRFRGGI